MLGIVPRLFGNLIVTTCFLSLTFFFLSLAISIRLLPKLLPFLRTLLRWFLILSYRFYILILTRLAPILHSYLDIDLLNGMPRVAATLLLSLALGLLLHLLTDLPVSGWIIALLAIHGLVVGLAWDELENPEGFRLGVNIQ